MKDEVTNVLRLANLVRENIRAKQFFTPHNSILVTLSGGQDSLCSLLLLYLLQNQLGLNLHARTKAALTGNSNSSSHRPQTLTFGVPAVALSQIEITGTKFRLPPERGVQRNCVKLELGLAPRSQAPVRKARVTVAIFNATRYHRGTTLFGRAHPPAEYGQTKHFSGLSVDRTRQLNKSVLTLKGYPELRSGYPPKGVSVARFSVVRGPSFYDRGPKRKIACVQPSITLDSCSAETRASKLEHHSSFGPSVLMASLAQPLIEQASDGPKQPNDAIENRPLLEKSTLQKTKTSVNSDLCLATQNETLFYSTDRSSCLNPLSPGTNSSLVNRCYRLQNRQTFVFSESFCFCSATRSKRHRQSKAAWSYPEGVTGTAFRQLNFRFAKVREARFKVRATRQKESSRFIGEVGGLWCNHLWQRESFYTMLHVAKINFCFSSAMCFYLPIKNVLSEQNAREWRHKSIQRTCTFYHYDCCTQGHTKSDRVETILFNILRGTGIAGLQSLQWKKSFYSFSCQRFYPCP